MFVEGQKVVCINDNFPVVKEYGTGRETDHKPKLRELLIIDEILGEYLRFGKYDSDNSFNWWIANHFSPINDEEIENEIHGILENVSQNFL